MSGNPKPETIGDLVTAMRESFHIPVEFIVTDVYTRDSNEGWYLTSFNAALKAYMADVPAELTSKDAVYDSWCEATDKTSYEVTDSMVLDRLERMAMLA